MDGTSGGVGEEDRSNDVAQTMGWLICSRVAVFDLGHNLLLTVAMYFAIAMDCKIPTPEKLYANKWTFRAKPRQET